MNFIIRMTYLVGFLGVITTGCLPKKSDSDVTKKIANLQKWDGFQKDIFIQSTLDFSHTFCLRADTVNGCSIYQVKPSGTTGKQGEADFFKCTVSGTPDNVSMRVEFEKPLKVAFVGQKQIEITSKVGRYPGRMLENDSKHWYFSDLKDGVCLPSQSPSVVTQQEEGTSSNTQEQQQSGQGSAQFSEQTQTQNGPGEKQLLVTLNAQTKVYESLDGASSSCVVKNSAPILVYVSYNSATQAVMRSQKKQLFSFKGADLQDGCAFKTGYVNANAVSCLQVGSGLSASTLNEFSSAGLFAKPCPR